MSLTTPARPREVDAPPKPDPLEALIEEARQHARRRRRRTWGAALAFVAIAGVFILILTHRSGTAPGDVTRAESVPLTTTRARMHNGPLTIMASPTNGYTGWFEFSRIRPDGALKPVVRCPDRQTAWCGQVESIDWSPDGTRLALSVTSVGNPNPYNGLHAINLATGRDTMLRRCSPECDWFDVDWSPDGARLAYVTRNWFDGQNEIHIVDARRRAAGEAEQHLLGRGDGPSWSPDGQWIAFSREVDGRRSVYVVRPSGLDGHLLIARGSAPAWAPDGRTIAYRPYRTGCRILLVTPEGSDVTPEHLRRCIRSGRFALSAIGPPVWSPDGRKLAFSAPGRDLLFGPLRHGTFVIDADGTNMRRVTASAGWGVMGQQQRPAWQPVR